MSPTPSRRSRARAKFTLALATGGALTSAGAQASSVGFPPSGAYYPPPAQRPAVPPQTAQTPQSQTGFPPVGGGPSPFDRFRRDQFVRQPTAHTPIIPKNIPILSPLSVECEKAIGDIFERKGDMFSEGLSPEVRNKVRAVTIGTAATFGAMTLLKAGVRKGAETGLHGLVKYGSRNAAIGLAAGATASGLGMLIGETVSSQDDRFKGGLYGSGFAVGSLLGGYHGWEWAKHGWDWARNVKVPPALTLTGNRRLATGIGVGVAVGVALKLLYAEVSFQLAETAKDKGTNWITDRPLLLGQPGYADQNTSVQQIRLLSDGRLRVDLNGTTDGGPLIWSPDKPHVLQAPFVSNLATLPDGSLAPTPTYPPMQNSRNAMLGYYLDSCRQRSAPGHMFPVTFYVGDYHNPNQRRLVSGIVDQVVDGADVEGRYRLQAFSIRFPDGRVGTFKPDDVTFVLPKPVAQPEVQLPTRPPTVENSKSPHPSGGRFSVPSPNDPDAQANKAKSDGSKSSPTSRPPTYPAQWAIPNGGRLPTLPSSGNPNSPPNPFALPAKPNPFQQQP